MSSKDEVKTPENTSNNIEYYTVKRGNTLSGIALKYGTTVNEIAGLNGIRTVNLIFTR